MEFPRLFCGALALAFIIGGCASDPPNLGEACTFNGAECTDGLACFATVPGGYCSQACTTAGSTAECPEGSVCGELASTANGKIIACLKICKVASGCRQDIPCSSLSGTDFKVCKFDLK
jgi:hypothetical protein